MNKLAIGFFLTVPALALALLCACSTGKNLAATAGSTTSQPPPTVTAPVWSPADASLAEYKAYTFTTQSSDGDLKGGDTYTWNFGDGTPALTQAPGEVTHAFTGPGPFNVQVTETDPQGLASAPAQAPVTVVAAPEPFSLTVVAPTQPTTQDTHAGNAVTLVYTVRALAASGEILYPDNLLLNPGDPAALPGIESSNGSGLFTLPVTYLAPPTGSKVLNASVQVQDDAGNLGPVVAIPPCTLTIVTTDTPPVVTLAAAPAIAQGPDTSFPGVAITFNATAKDAEFDPLTYGWSFGDGGLGDIASTTDPGALTQTHTFQDAGTYTVTFTADDGWPGGKTPATLAMAILPDSAPVLAVTYAPAAPVYTNVPVTFNANATDPSDHTLSYVWTVNGQQQGAASSFTWTFTHFGPQTVQLAASDGLGESATWSATLNALDNPPPVATLSDNPAVPLQQYVPHTFTAAATDAVAGNTIASYQWLISGQPQVTTPGPTCTFAPPSSGTINVQVQAVDNHGAVGAPSAPATFQVLPENQPNVNSNQGLSSAEVAVGGAWTTTGTFTVTETPVAGNPAFLPPQSIQLNAGDPAGSGQVTSTGIGSYSFTLTYQAAATPGARVVQPTVTVVDANGVPSSATSLGTATLTTVAALGPITLGYANLSAATGSLISGSDFAVVVGNPSGNPTTVTVAWGDGTAPASALLSFGQGSTSVTTYFSHQYAQSGTFQVTTTATDGQATAMAAPLSFSILPDAYPTATITSPTASANLPPAGTFPAGGPVLPPLPGEPGVLVVPLNGTVTFQGTFTPPTVGTCAASWVAPGAIPTVEASQQEATYQFPGTPGQMTPYLVTYQVIDQLGRSSSDPASGNAPGRFSKWVVVDGVHSQVLNVSGWYRQVSDRTGQASLVPATQTSDGLGAQVTLFQDGVAQTYPLQNAAGTQAALALPMRGDLPAYLELPPILASDAHAFVLTIPNQPNGPNDPWLTQPTDARSALFFQNPTLPWNPTLKLVLAQGFGPESGTPARKTIQGALTSLAAADPGANGWLDRLTAETAQEPSGDSALQAEAPLPASLSFNGNQAFAEWPMLMVPQATPSQGAPPLPSFTLDYQTFALDGNQSQGLSVGAWQAFRVPGSTTDPYDASSATNGWNAPTCLAALNPTALPPTLPAFWQNAVYANQGAGGLQNFMIPYAPDDPDRALIPPVQRPFTAGAPATLAYAEYLWSTVWAQPLVLNSAELGASDTAGPWTSFKGFDTAAPTAWPQLLTSIPPDQSTFNLTPTGGASFSAASPVGVNGAAVPAGGVGRFFWTAFTPAYGPNGGALVTRTWLAAQSTNQPPTSAAPAAPGLATTTLGLIPPQDVSLDIRGRDPLTGQVTGPTGGYRILWFNPTVDSSGNVVAPDFWVVAVGTQHLLVPASYPASPDLGGPVLTDAPSYLPSGNPPAQGPAATDQVAPGYCWFDVPAPFRPASDPGQTLNITVFGIKSVLDNAPPAMARPLAFPDWVDALRLNTAGASVVVDSNGLVDFSDAYGVPFQFPWDIVLANGAVATVAQ